MTVKRQRTTLKARSIGRIAVSFWQETSGVTALEYGLIVALIAVAILGSIILLGESLFGLPLGSVVDALAGVLS
jgi:Flp pilus assembly pilin Flp